MRIDYIWEVWGSWYISRRLLVYFLCLSISSVIFHLLFFSVAPLTVSSRCCLWTTPTDCLVSYFYNLEALQASETMMWAISNSSVVFIIFRPSNNILMMRSLVKSFTWHLLNFLLTISHSSSNNPPLIYCILRNTFHRISERPPFTWVLASRPPLPALYTLHALALVHRCYIYLLIDHSVNCIACFVLTASSLTFAH